MANNGLTGGLGSTTSKGTTITQAILDAAAGDAAGNLVIIEDNTKQIEQALNKAIAKALEEIGMRAESAAKKNLTASGAVDTGRLRASVTHQLDTSTDSVYIGTNVEYAPYIELGTRKMKARPYLRPAASDHADEYRAVLKKNLENA